MHRMSDSALRREISRLVLREREAAGLSHAELAARIGMNANSISRIERGTMAPSLDSVERIFTALGLTIRFSLGRQEPETVAIKEDPDAWLPLSTRLDKSGVGTLMRTLDTLPYVIDGSLAATMQGVPLPVELLELDLAWRDATRFTGRLVRRLAYRWHEGHREFRVHDLDPRAPGAHYWQTATARVRARMVDELPASVEVKVGDAVYHVRPLEELQSGDPETDAMLAGVRAGNVTTG
jgi:transcriptional regulator with XRE-family HTH domain